MRKWREKTGKKVKIVVIDSGIEGNHVQLKRHSFAGIAMIENGYGEIELVNDYTDHLGHGTAITYLIKKVAPDSEIFMIKLFEKGGVEYDKLVAALELVRDHIKPDIVHLSNGIVECEDINAFRQLCRDICEQGIIIVSAFDNAGSISYPAAFDEVIGVDWYKECTKVNDYIFIENSKVNILGYGLEQRLPWIDNSYKRVGGSSFAAPLITAYIAQMLEYGIAVKDEILEELKKEAMSIRTLSQEEEIPKLYTIDKAIIFPFNKEIQTLSIYEDLLNFAVVGYYDYRGSKNIGKKINELTNSENTHIVKNYQSIDWSGDFDTVILGHTKEMAKYSRVDFADEFLKNCMKWKKNIFSFDKITDYLENINENEKNIKIYTPDFQKENLPKIPAGKLRRFGKPVLCIMGTSSKQGKFSLQLKIRKILQEKGYKVGQLGTEPSSQLFGIDEVLPIGYGSDYFKLRGENMIQSVNFLMGKIEDTNPDLIILGTQSQTIPYSMGNIMFYPIFSQEILWGSEPDGVILCVNVHDNKDYIERTIKYIENVVETKVICLAISPLNFQEFHTIFGGRTELISIEQMKEFKGMLAEKFDKNVYAIGDDDEVEKLVVHIEDFFTEE